ncbi:polyamine aminopropyltransferase [Cognatishimia sp. F0-27]|nr:polyamine aminopropyltransferase [Cognatishimia sp. F0-27]
MRIRELWLLLATFIIAIAGLVYELIAATVSSYLLGDSVRQFSLVIGVFLSSMGVGAYLSRYVGKAMQGFVWAQICLGVVGGFMAPVLFFTYAALGEVAFPLYGMLIAVGILSGMEIPLIARVLKEIGAPEFRFENVLTVDYVGALVASLAFPLFVIPYLGLMSASLVFGLLNLAVAGLSLWLFRAAATRAQWGFWGVAVLASLLALIQAERLVSVAQAQLFEDDVVLSEATPYQTVTLTRFGDRVRFYLDASIQFDTMDEHRYHEALVHPAMALAPRRKSVLILGGGDGMAVREVLRHEDVAAVTLVDLDPRVTELFRDHPDLAPLNDRALSDPRVRIVNMDAWRFAEQDRGTYDVIIADLPDPKTIALSKLYSREFYALLVERLSGTGVLVTQAGSPLFAREAFWSIVTTLEATRSPSGPAARLSLRPYTVYVPSFGQWGFAMATPMPLARRALQLPEGLAFLTPEIWEAAQVFAPDMDRVPVSINDIQSHALVGYYLDGWDRWFR